MPDPIINGMILPSSINKTLDYEQFVLDTFGKSFPGMNRDMFIQFLEKEINHGKSFCGRDDYYNNGLYYAGNSYHGRSMGTPYFFSKDQISTFSKDFQAPYDLLFINNRVKAHFFALNGWLTQNLSYHIKMSFTVNHGTYTGKYTGRYKWDYVEDYFFDGGLKENYFNLVLRHSPECCDHWTLGLMVAKDWGEIYKSSAIGFNLSYRFTSFSK